MPPQASRTLVAPETKDKLEASMMTNELSQGTITDSKAVSDYIDDGQTSPNCFSNAIHEEQRAN